MSENRHEQYMRRCFALARLGAGSVSPNPMVGAILVHNDRIIGEGWHQRYGAAHAEVNAVASVAPEDRHLMPDSTLYCTLEPCHHFGKTPPCVDLVLRENIRRVVISNTDPNPLVAGQSIRKLQGAGVEVLTGVLEAEGFALNRPFFKWINTQKPYIILKWAQSQDGFIAKHEAETAISGALTKRLVHQWRSEVDAILVGTNTAVIDNPRLDNRLYFGKSPLRIALDLNGKIPLSMHLLDDSTDTLIVGRERTGTYQKTTFLPAPSDHWIETLLLHLAEIKQPILLVEGGTSVLNQFIAQGYWDEIRLIENEQQLFSGKPAPIMPKNVQKIHQMQIENDHISSWIKI